jgi:mannose PTS system EIIA component
MNAVMVAAHGNFAIGLKDSYTMIMGESNHIFPIALKDGVESFSMLMEKQVEELLEKYEGIMILCDLKGGTPYNTALKQMFTHPERIKVVAGVNLPLLIELSLLLEKGIHELAEEAITIGIQSITD